MKDGKFAKPIKPDDSNPEDKAVKLIEIDENYPADEGTALIDKISILDENIFKNSRWGREAFLENIRNSYDHLVVLKAGNSVPLGYGLLRVFDDAEVVMAAVDESFRLRGFGKLIVNELIRLAKKDKAKSIFLEVRESNLPAIRLYESLGFERAGIRSGYYSDPKEDAIIMRYIC